MGQQTGSANNGARVCPMHIEFGREICGNLSQASTREWLVTNGIGGYASGTIAGLLTRRYHGLLVAALQPPLGRTLMLTKLDETANYADREYALHTNCWANAADPGRTIAPHGYHSIEAFGLEGSIPTWHFALGDARLAKRIWMQPGENTTYIQYQLSRATQPLHLQIQALVNYRDYHGMTQGEDGSMAIAPIEQGVVIQANPDAAPLYLYGLGSTIAPAHTWYLNFDLAIERYRGLSDRENHLHAATLTITLQPGETFTVVASTTKSANQNGETARPQRQLHDQLCLDRWHTQNLHHPAAHLISPEWIQQLVLAADQFIVNRPQPNDPHGKTVIAGYPWFSDWGRDTMISLPGLTLTTGRPEIARSILRTFAQHIDQGMIPNRFPDTGQTPEYNTVDATLWYFEAMRLYHQATGDDHLLRELFPALAAIIDWHCRGTRDNIHLDASDGLLYAGAAGVQLTWMDAKVGDWVVTPRIGKPIEINALWYNALRTIAQFARQLNQPDREYDALADRTLAQFSRFWNAERGYGYDVLDGPTGDDDALRPNQIFAVSLPHGVAADWPALFNPQQQRQIVDRCGQKLLTSYGLRSRSPDHPDYHGHYGGNQLQRDGAYHQGTTWGWLIGPFVQAHLRVYQNPTLARQLLEPMAHQLQAHGLGSLSEIFDGDAPIAARGCIAQAWTVAEVLRAWVETHSIQDKTTTAVIPQQFTRG
jgi:predicted glycogen debranching enzyme